MFITLKTLLHTLLLPPGGPLLLAAAGAWLLRSRSSAATRRAGWLLLAAGLASQSWSTPLPTCSTPERESFVAPPRPVATG